MQEYEMRAEIVLSPGHYVFSRNGGASAEQLFASVRFGPDAHQAQAQSEPADTTMTNAYGIWWFRYARKYLLDGDPMFAELTINQFPPDDNWPARIVVDRSFMADELVSGVITLRYGEDPMMDFQALSSCQDHLHTTVIQASTPGGDQAVLSRPGVNACSMSGNTTCYLLSHARVTVAGEITDTNDPFSLVYSAGHHNHCEDYVVFLDVPTNGIHAVRIHKAEWCEMEGLGNFFYLDENLQEVRSEAIESWQEDP